MSLLKGKNALIFGLANDYSIAWGIAKKFKEFGCNIAFSYMNDAIKKRVEPLAQDIGADFIFKMDVSSDDDYKHLNAEIKKHWDQVDIVVHSIAFADREDLKDSFVKTSRDGFKLACDISSYSLVGISKEISPLMINGGSIMSLTYYGANKVVQNYNVMGVAKAALESTTRYLANDLGPLGIKVNAISAGPIKTLAASGISGFRSLLSQVEEKAPLRKNVTQEDVGGTAVYLASELSNGVTGQVLYVDSGLSILGGF